MRTIVIYKSKSGFTKKYAEWIAEELAADLFASEKVTPEMLRAYDTVIFGGGLHIVGINGVKLITQHLDLLQDKKVVVFAVGSTPPREEDLAEVRTKNFTPEQLEQIHFFYLRGGFDFGKLKPMDKVLMTLMKLRLKSKKKLTADERGLLAAYEKPADFTWKKNIDELIAYVKA